jgi:archaellum component FlaG (FlaF/FlaG flagellin family)
VGDPDDMFNYQTAHGVYEIVYYTVNNVGNEPESVDSMSQKLFIDNREYSSDMMASENVSRQVRDSAFLNPGFSADLVVAFDVPTGSREGVLEVHTSSFSDKGARIDLSNASG